MENYRLLGSETVFAIAVLTMAVIVMSFIVRFVLKSLPGRDR